MTILSQALQACAACHQNPPCIIPSVIDVAELGLGLPVASGSGLEEKNPRRTTTTLQRRQWLSLVYLSFWHPSSGSYSAGPSFSRGGSLPCGPPPPPVLLHRSISPREIMTRPALVKNRKVVRE